MLLLLTSPARLYANMVDDDRILLENNDDRIEDGYMMIGFSDRQFLNEGVRLSGAYDE